LDHYWTDENRQAFLIFSEDNLAGLALVENLITAGMIKIIDG
jgi:predicted acetyltransferase